MTNQNITLHHGDIPDEVFESLGDIVAMDCEMMGLNALRDKLCLVQLSDDGENVHLVKFDITREYDAPNLTALLNDDTICKIFHFARSDMATLVYHLKVNPKNIYCTKMASKLCRTYSDKHSLKPLLKELLGIDASKEQQLSNWGASFLTDEQLIYAASDVEHLHSLKEELDKRVARLGRTELLSEINNFIPTAAKLDLDGWGVEILNHH